MTKAEYKKHHSKVVQYICAEYMDFHFIKMKNGSLLIQLSPIDKHYFHLLIKTFAMDTTDSINNIAFKVVNELYLALFGKTKS